MIRQIPLALMAGEPSGVQGTPLTSPASAPHILIRVRRGPGNSPANDSSEIWPNPQKKEKSGSALTDPFDNLAPGVYGMFRRWRCEPDVGMVAV